MSSIFDDKASPPDDPALAQALGRAKAHWDALAAHLEQIGGDVTLEWKFYGKKHGWQLKATRKQRAVVYLVPHQGSFLFGAALRQSALDALPEARLPASLVKEILSAEAFPEGRPARLEITRKAQVGHAKRLLALKLAHP